MQATAGPFPRADAALTQPQGRQGKHCVASTHEEHAGGGNERCWGGEAIMRPKLHWQCQLGTVPYTVLYFTVNTVFYGLNSKIWSPKFEITLPCTKRRSVPYS
jgi:hypothetical protein